MFESMPVASTCVRNVIQTGDKLPYSGVIIVLYIFIVLFVLCVYSDIHKQSDCSIMNVCIQMNTLWLRSSVKKGDIQWIMCVVLCV